VAAVAHGIHSTWYGYVDLRGARAENEDLRARTAALESQVTTYRNDARESERLREILDIQKAMPMKSVVARIQARDALPWFRVVTIDKGRRHGVALNAPVVCPAGVVGRVIELGDDAAKVQVLLDQGSGIGVVSERSRATGVVSGPIGSRDDLPPDERGALDRALDVASRRDLAMKYVSAVSDIAVGDAVVTSGFDQLYPKGLMVGRVSYVGPPSGLFKEVRVTPSARPDALEEVMVLETPQAKAVSNPERVK
jgi:rod shape-determining protein MreC